MNQVKSIGGKREGSGRKAEYKTGPMTTISVRVTDEQKAAYKKIGGSRWLRDHLDTIIKEHLP